MITLGEAEGALATFGAAFLGYLVEGGFVFTDHIVGSAAVVGGIAALGFLGYNVVSGNISSIAPVATPPVAP